MGKLIEEEKKEVIVKPAIDGVLASLEADKETDKVDGNNYVYANVKAEYEKIKIDDRPELEQLKSQVAGFLQALEEVKKDKDAASGDDMTADVNAKPKPKRFIEKLHAVATLGLQLNSR